MLQDEFNAGVVSQPPLYTNLKLYSIFYNGNVI
jgi:hypothetical protein